MPAQRLITCLVTLIAPVAWPLPIAGLVVLALVGAAILRLVRWRAPRPTAPARTATVAGSTLAEADRGTGDSTAAPPSSAAFVRESTTSPAVTDAAPAVPVGVVPAAPVAVSTGVPAPTPASGSAPEARARAAGDPFAVAGSSGLRLFISHSTADNAFGLRLAADLRAALGGDETSVWYDASGGLQGGDVFLEQIAAELTSRDIFLLILSPAALASPWVQDELRMAWNQKNSAAGTDLAGKVIIPILYQPCEVPAYLATIQYVSFVVPRPYVEALAELVRAIRTSGARTAAVEQRPIIPLGLPFEEDLLLVPAHFVGREADLAWLEARLQAGGATALTALEGLGGIGKTALAAVAVHHLRRAGSFPDGIAVALCQNVTDPAEVLARVLTRFDPQRKVPQETTVAELARHARYALAGKHALVVLDNVEPGLPVTEVVGPLREAGLTLLLTARQAMPLDVVPAGASRTLDLLSPDEALELFAWALGREHADALSPSEHAAAARIVAALGRHTLAVRLAGAYAAGVGRDLGALATELERDPLEVPSAETPRGVALILSRSTAALPEGARQLFAALVAFATPEFGRQAALALAEGLGQVHPRGSVDLLVQRALAEGYAGEGLTAEADRERLRLHPLLRAFAADLFARWPEAERHAAMLAVTHHLAAYAETHQTDYRALDADEGNLTGALEWAEAYGQFPSVADLAYSLREFWIDRGRYREGGRFLASGIAAVTRMGGGERREAQGQLARLQLAYGTVLIYSGQLEAGNASAQRSLEGFRTMRDSQGEGLALRAIGEAARWRGQFEAAEGYLQESVAIAREVGDRQGEGVSLSQLGQVALLRGQFEAAEGYLQESLIILREVGDRGSEGADLSVLGRAALLRGQFEAAEGYLQESVTIAREVGDRQGEGVSLSWLGQVVLRRGQFEAAEGYLQESLIIFREVGDRRSEGVSLGEFGRVALRRGQLEATEAFLRESLGIAREVGDRQSEGEDLSVLGQVALRRGQFEAAEGYLQESLIILREVGSRRWEARVLVALGRVAEAQDDLARAEIHYRQSVTLAAERGLEPELPEAQLALGRLLAERLGRQEEGCLLLLEAARRYAETGMPEADEAREALERLACEEEVP